MKSIMNGHKYYPENLIKYLKTYTLIQFHIAQHRADACPEKITLP